MRILLLILALMLSASRCGESQETVSVMKAGDAEAIFSVEPVFPESEHNERVKTMFTVSGSGPDLTLTGIGVTFSPDSETGSLDALTAWYTGVVPGVPVKTQWAKSDNPAVNTLLKGNLAVGEGKHTFVLDFGADPEADPSSKLKIESVTFSFSDGSSAEYIAGKGEGVIRLGRIVRKAGQDGADTYRIPGIVTTNSGTLVAVYDIRYNNSKDLQEDIDIGMSRSTDGGRSWEPMKVIMDMGEYGGLSQNLNGIGDPCILYDHFTNTLWAAALWMSGSAPDKMLWWASMPGMTPQETGQFMLVKSTDEGLTWSAPVNITGQIKSPAWQLLLQGPGRGITMSDGTLVFPAQFKADLGVKAIDGGQYTCHSTIVYSKDGGVSWHIGTGAKSNTTEAQVAELADGTLMLNMRDDRNRADKGEANGRAVAVTADLGQTWTTHPTSNSALPEPNCMASLIAAKVKIGGEYKRVLFFSNPADKSSRIKMTIRMSTDEGMTWPATNAVEVYAPQGYGYSCLTMVDEEHVGILYEGTKELYFQKIPVRDFFDEGN
ncbi:MAG: glycoside hydrolase [Bacteroidales bacterium]|jgi:sialidase-1|nr:glycoside hydrolase [Bacteroidales bacterium]